MFSHVASADPLCHCIQGGPFPMTWRTHGLDVIPIGLPKAANIIVHHFLKTKMETDKKSLPAKCVEPRAVFLQVLHIVANPPCIYSWRLYVTYMYRYIILYMCIIYPESPRLNKQLSSGWSMYRIHYYWGEQFLVFLGAYGLLWCFKRLPFPLLQVLAPPKPAQPTGNQAMCQTIPLTKCWRPEPYTLLDSWINS